MRYTTAELAELESRIASAAERALALELRLFDDLVGEVIGAPRRDRRRGRGARRARRRRRACRVRRGSATGCGPRSIAGTAFEIEGGRHPVVEAALRRQGRRFIANDCVLGRGPHLARHRPQHGRQVHLPAPERADRDPGADRRLRAGARGADRHRRPAVQPGRRRPTIWRAAARPSWSRWSRPRRS